MMFTFPPKKILIPVDGSPLSEHAWQHAKSLSRLFPATFEALYVQPSLEQVDPVYFPPEAYDAILKSRLAKIHAVISSGTHLKIASGHPAAVILNYLNTGKYHMAVMGTHGRKGIERALLGSVAEAIVHRSPVPVLTVKSHPTAVNSILVPINPTPHAQLGLEFAAQMALRLKAKIRALYVADAIEDMLSSADTLEEKCQSTVKKVSSAVACETRIQKGNVVEEILKEAEKHDLVVLLAHAKWLVKDMVLGTTAERVLRYCQLPVLTVPFVQPAKNEKTKSLEEETLLSLGGA